MTSVALAAILTVTLPLGDCQLDSAVITFVPPHTLHVVAVSDCGTIKCWDKWIEVDGKRVGMTRACSTSGSGETFTEVPSPAAPAPTPAP